MSIFTDFLGDNEKERVARLVLNPQLENHLSLQMLVKGRFDFDSGEVTAALRSFHDSMADAKCLIESDPGNEDNIFGILCWANHVVKLIGLHSPMPPEIVESCIASPLYPRELKERVQAHDGYLIFHYAGYETSPHEQYVALAAVAGALARFGGILVLNEFAYSSLPVDSIFAFGEDGDTMELLRALPLAILYCGFVMYEVEGFSGVWMRTHGAYLLGLPDLATHAAEADDESRFFDIFDNIYRYLRQSGTLLAPGDTMRLTDNERLKFRAAREDEYFLDDNGEVIVVEIIGAEEVDR